MLALAPACWHAVNARVARRFGNADGTFRYRRRQCGAARRRNGALSRVSRSKYLHPPVGQQGPNSSGDDLLVVRRAEMRFERVVVAVVLDQHETRFVRNTLKGLIADAPWLAERSRSEHCDIREHSV